ncbi:hypothetical protein M885DRAFT_615163 [Pelagophyceae sp. CCMP2097]|nr:hypothetical protein M885DRAFT_615163 [Pelagophyceae sp. CCMP2097]
MGLWRNEDSNTTRFFQRASVLGMGEYDDETPLDRLKLRLNDVLEHRGQRARAASPPASKPRGVAVEALSLDEAIDAIAGLCDARLAALRSTDYPAPRADAANAAAVAAGEESARSYVRDVWHATYRVRCVAEDKLRRLALALDTLDADRPRLLLRLLNEDGTAGLDAVVRFASDLADGDASIDTLLMARRPAASAARLAVPVRGGCLTLVDRAANRVHAVVAERTRPLDGAWVAAHGLADAARDWSPPSPPTSPAPAPGGLESRRRTSTRSDFGGSTARSQGGSTARSRGSLSRLSTAPTQVSSNVYTATGRRSVSSSHLIAASPQDGPARDHVFLLSERRGGPMVDLEWLLGRVVDAARGNAPPPGAPRTALALFFGEEVPVSANDGALPPEADAASRPATAASARPATAASNRSLTWSRPSTAASQRPAARRSSSSRGARFAVIDDSGDEFGTDGADDGAPQSPAGPAARPPRFACAVALLRDGCGDEVSFEEVRAVTAFLQRERLQTVNYRLSTARCVTLRCSAIETVREARVRLCALLRAPLEDVNLFSRDDSAAPLAEDDRVSAHAAHNNATLHVRPRAHRGVSTARGPLPALAPFMLGAPLGAPHAGGRPRTVATMTPQRTLRRKAQGLISGDVIIPAKRWPAVNLRGLLPHDPLARADAGGKSPAHAPPRDAIDAADMPAARRVAAYHAILLTAGLVLPVRRFAGGPAAEIRELFVGNLPRGATVDDVRAAFAPVCAAVLDIRVPLGNSTGRSRGYAFVTIEATAFDHVRREMDGAMMMDSCLAVDLATTDRGAPVQRANLAHRPPVRSKELLALNTKIVSCANAADVLSLFEDKGADFDFVNLATSLHILGVLSGSFEKSEAPLLQKLVKRATSSVVDDAQRWEPRHLANACWGIAKIEDVEVQALFEAVSGVASSKMATFEAQNFANIVWAYSRAGVKAPALFKAVAAEAPKKIASFKPQELANTVWAFAKAGVAAPGLFEAIAADSSKRIATFYPQPLSNTMWAFAKAGVEAPALFEAVAAEAPKKIPMFNPQDLANTVWAYATAGVKARMLFEAVAAEASKKIAAFNPQDLANTVWAYAAAGVKAPVLFEAVAAAVEAPTNIATFSPQTLSNIVLAYATAGVEAPAMFKAVAVEATQKIGMFKPHELSNIVRAFAKAGVGAPALFAAVAAEAPRKMVFFSSQIADMVWAFAKAGVAAQKLFDSVAAEAPKKMANCTTQDLANIVRAYATAGVGAPVLFEAVANEALRKMATFNPQDLASIAWAYSVAGVEAPALFEAIAVRIEAKISDFSPDGLSQMHQVYMYLRLEAPQHALTLLLSRHEAELRAAYSRQESTPSRSQKLVSAVLFDIDWEHELEHVTAEGIRVGMAQPAAKVAVEFDGPTHYLAGSSRGVSTAVLSGASKFKERLLRGLGWQLVRVPYFEWDALHSSALREAYLRSKTNSEASSV